jgi:uncharacterized membrane protein
MSLIEKSIELNVPVRTAYNQWTQFEEFPKFMEGVTEVKQIDDKRLQWKANIAGKDEEWNSEITEQISNATSKLMLQLEYNPQGFVEKAGDAMGLVTLRVQRDLERFKIFIESRGQETDAWRGTIT